MVNIKMINSININFDITNIIKEVFKENIVEISKNNNIITLKLIDNTQIDITIEEDSKINTIITTYINYYSQIKTNNTELKNNVIRQFEICNNILTIKFDYSSNEQTSSIIKKLFDIAKETGGILILPDASLYDKNTKLILSREGNSQLDKFYATAQESLIIQNDNQFSEEDNIRIQKNIKILKKLNLPYNENMKLIPRKDNTELASKDEIFITLILDYILATMACTFPNEIDEEHWNNIYTRLNLLYGVETFIDDEYKEILEAIKNNDTNLNKTNLTWLYEGCAILLWVLGSWEFPSQSSQCNVNDMNNMLFSNPNNTDTLPDIFKMMENDNNEFTIDNLKMKSYEEILEKTDLLNRYKWALDEAEINNLDIDYNISRTVLEYQLDALREILRWNSNSEN